MGESDQTMRLNEAKGEWSALRHECVQLSRRLDALESKQSPPASPSQPSEDLAMGWEERLWRDLQFIIQTRVRIDITAFGVMFPDFRQLIRKHAPHPKPIDPAVIRGKAEKVAAVMVRNPPIGRDSFDVANREGHYAIALRSDAPDSRTGHGAAMNLRDYIAVALAEFAQEILHA